MKAIHTRSQQRILTLLKTTKKGISAQEIYVELRSLNQNMGLATVYRSLETLKLEGLVQMRRLGNGEALYSLTKQDKHHLTCLQCGTSVTINQCPAHGLEEQLQEKHNFKIFYHTLEFFGLCQKCHSLEG
ncbi:Fur family transcriptional regulator [Calothrix rhizosoleniae]|uniref:Fur family transcriptional regulator n=1 Tax=Calothrix rhizosoleniae TaxID=888997 RepID=UPI000B4A2BC2|nr:transcriptional repressor [Calothrix rhizosoleniae]